MLMRTRHAGTRGPVADRSFVPGATLLFEGVLLVLCRLESLVLATTDKARRAGRRGSRRSLGVGGFVSSISRSISIDLYTSSLAHSQPSMSELREHPFVARYVIAIQNQRGRY